MGILVIEIMRQGFPDGFPYGIEIEVGVAVVVVVVVVAVVGDKLSIMTIRPLVSLSVIILIIITEGVQGPCQ